MSQRTAGVEAFRGTAEMRLMYVFLFSVPKVWQWNWECLHGPLYQVHSTTTMSVNSVLYRYEAKCNFCLATLHAFCAAMAYRICQLFCVETHSIRRNAIQSNPLFVHKSNWTRGPKKTIASVYIARLFHFCILFTRSSINRRNEPVEGTHKATKNDTSTNPHRN